MLELFLTWRRWSGTTYGESGTGTSGNWHRPLANPLI
jgi:hypothetical protein